MNQEPDQQALFQIEGPDEDGCVWVRSQKGRGDWSQNLGSKNQVADAMVAWLRSIGHYPDTQFWAPIWNQKN